MIRLALLLAVFPLAACPVTQPPPAANTEARAAMLRATASCLQSELEAFEAKADQLVVAVGGSDGDAARAAWREAMTQWEVLELMQVGPAASAMSPGGKGLRDAVYAWPLTTRCVLEEALVAKSYEGDLSRQLVNRRTLAALEYLLFSADTQTACPASSSIVSSGSWAALSADELAARRLAYARAAALDVKAQTHALVDLWRNGFTQALAEPGTGNRYFMTQQSALNAVSDALFYFDKQTKDAKLAGPLGLAKASCATPPCLEALELPNARHDTQALRANLIGFRKIVQGCGPGYSGSAFDDLLIAAGATSLEGRLKERLETAQTSFDAAPPLHEALSSPTARGLYDDVKAVTDLLKSEFITVLDLELPTSLEGDND
ncbi:MAG: imelysin family protein [Archangium sp.]|nr:imelysin family protein [Archangium sp.]